MSYKRISSIHNQVIKLYQFNDWKILPNNPFYLTEWANSIELGEFFNCFTSIYRLDKAFNILLIFFTFNAIM